MEKAEFLSAHGFPHQWLAWNLYPDNLFDVQRAACAGDEDPSPHEHLRYGAFHWWLRSSLSLPEPTLLPLARLAVLDPDPAMAGAAAHDILFHPSATEEVADELARLADGHPRWNRWAALPTTFKFFRRTLDEGRQFWADRHATHRILHDVGPNQISMEELRELFARRSPLVLRALVEHPGLPADLVAELAAIQGIRFAKEIRTIAKLREVNKPNPYSFFRQKYSTDPWSWPK